MVYNLEYYFNKGVQEDYRRRHDGSDNTIQLNDVAFSVHVCPILHLYLKSPYLTIFLF